MNEASVVRRGVPLATVVVRNPAGSAVLTTVADAAGTFSVAGLAPGPYVVEMTDNAGATTKASIEVLGVVLEKPDALAFTGTNALSLVWAAIGFIGSGAWLVRRRRPATRNDD